MTAHSKGKETNSLSGQARVKVEPDYSVLAGEDFSFSGISGNRNGGLNGLIQRIMRRNCDSVLQIATPHTSDIHTVVGKLSRDIAADLEARMSKAARGKRRVNDPRGRERPKYLLDVLAAGVLKWVGHQSSLSSESSRYKDNSEATRLEADYVSPFFEAFLLFVAHHINKHFTKRNATRLHISEDCRLILPIANKDVETEDSGTDSVYHFNPADYVDPAEFTNVECGMFPIRSTVERQPAPALHLIVANAEIVRHKDNYNEAELKLAKKTKALLFNQHNRRFA
ncbi:hypothetical protein H4S07_001782 [Coemansia furcata]|uniref:Uncharacterized protein n=1 Tax=Coemansia furcata TaxID=417177 RepID=A0ACC1LMM4_9FUNG|nr:hypothetical protein H4S07_001782 [Coemansia furcata]